MTQFSGYIFRQTLWPTLFFLLVLTGVVWLSQGPKLLVDVINRGQNASTFLELTIFLLPSLVLLVLPIALFCAVLYTLNRLYTDSEIVVMWSVGLGRWSVALPVFALALIMTAFGYLLSVYLMPLGYRAMKDKVYEIRSDLTTNLFREGAFTYPIQGMTVFVREVGPNGELKGIFVQDARKTESQGTYIAESGQLVRTSRGPMLIMHDGVVIRSQAQTGGNPIFVPFEQAQYLPEEFGQTRIAANRDYNERYLPELFRPNPDNAWEVKNRGRLISEGHLRLALPLYNIALPMIAMVFLLCGSFSRRGFGARLICASAIAIVVRVAAEGAHSVVQNHLGLWFVHYLIPLGTIGVCALMLSGIDILAPLKRLRLPRLAPAQGAR